MNSGSISFGKWVNTVRADNDKSLHEFAIMINLSITTVHNIEKGRHDARLSWIQRICDIFKVEYTVKPCGF